MKTELPIRLVTATSLFDGHDAAINVMRRIMQREGAEVVHLGHNRSVEEIVEAAIQEDANAVAVSSYQGGHMEFFQYMVDRLKELGGGRIKVFGGGGGTIVPEEIAALEAYGVAKIYGPEAGQKLGLVGMIRDLLSQCRAEPEIEVKEELERLPRGSVPALARLLTFNELHVAQRVNDEAGQFVAHQARRLAEQQVAAKGAIPVLGITGTGGAGKSSLTDELVRRFLDDFGDKRVAILSVDPTQRRTGGALLGDRIRMNAVTGGRAFMRSLATRQEHLALAASVRGAVQLCRAAGFDLIIVETAGIGQSDTEIVDLADFTVYVMTAEYGAASQLEKIGMLDFADLIAINKFDKAGGQDALRDVRKQVRRNRGLFKAPEEELPVFGTVASRFQDPATDRFYGAVVRRLGEKVGLGWESRLRAGEESPPNIIIPPRRVRYLAEIADAVRGYKQRAEEQARTASRAYGLRQALEVLGVPVPEGPHPLPAAAAGPLAPARSAAGSPPGSVGSRAEASATTALLAQAYHAALDALAPEWRAELAGFDALQAEYAQERFTFQVRGREIKRDNFATTLSHTRLPRIALPRFRDWGDRLRWLMLENVPGSFPYTGGVFPFKRAEEEPTRMFAGEGLPERTNRRFHFIAQGQRAKRLSTAFDSVTLYGEDPHPRPDIFGKVGNSGVSICSLDDMKRLYSGFDLLHPLTSVSMTINGPAPIMLAFFLNTAIDQRVERHLKEQGLWEDARGRMAGFFAAGSAPAPQYRSELPPGHDGLGLGLLGVSGDRLVPPDVYARLKEETLRTVRGTVQADILKEDQAQNTCIFSADFALKMMGDIQEYFCRHDMPNFYSVSVSGYHMAEAGANPITQVAFTLANGFTFVEYYLSRGLDINQFARNLSFFFSNGMDPEYAVIGRVARRIWAVALKQLYRADERAQKLKYHIQTSGRSLHAQEISFNDIRTTLQALYAVYDNCNSLHTNAYDEAITTPTEESVRRAIAIQLIINRELGLAQNHNPLQGSFIIEELTDLVEEAILAEFDRLTERGGVLGAMETMYQRGKIQDESLFYEEQKDSGAYPIVGINTYVDPAKAGKVDRPPELIRSTAAEKDAQIASLAAYHQLNAAASGAALEQVREACRRKGNIFAALLEAAKCCSLGQISATLYQMGGQYRRNM